MVADEHREGAVSIEKLLEEFGDPEYTQEQFNADRARLLAVLSAKHGVAESEVDLLIREHRYTHSAEDPEDESCLSGSHPRSEA